MPSLDELMARGDAAGGSMRDSGAPDAGAMPPPDATSQPSDDLDGALAQVETVVQGLNPDIADQAREHLNAIRELVAAAPEAQGGPDQGKPSGPDALPPPDAGMMADLGTMGEKGAMA